MLVIIKKTSKEDWNQKYISLSLHEDGASSEEGSPWPSRSWSQSKGFECKENSSERHPQPRKRRRSTWHQPSDSLRHHVSEGSPNILREAPGGETSWTTLPSSSSPWLPSQPWRRQKTTAHLCSLWMSRPASTGSHWLWTSSVTLMWPRPTPDQARWRENGIL